MVLYQSHMGRVNAEPSPRRPSKTSGNLETDQIRGVDSRSRSAEMAFTEAWDLESSRWLMGGCIVAALHDASDTAHIPVLLPLLAYCKPLIVLLCKRLMASVTSNLTSMIGLKLPRNQPSRRVCLKIVFYSYRSPENSHGDSRGP